MIHISNDQLEKLELQCRKNLATHLTEIINTHLLPFIKPSSTTNITDRIESALSRASEIGIRKYQCIVHFVIMCLILNDRFDEHPAIQKLTQTPDGDVHLKINAIFFELQWHALQTSGIK